MCIICIEMDKNKLSPWEAKRNLKEIAQEIDQDHLIEVENKISDAIFEEINLNYGDTLDEEVDFSSFCSLHSACNVKND